MFLFHKVGRSRDVFEVHGIEFLDDVSEGWSLLWVFMPASLHQVEEHSWGFLLSDLRSETLLDHSLTHNLPIDSIVGWFSSSEFPENDSKTEHISLLCILETVDDFWCHPLISTDLRCHHLGLDSCPTEVSQLTVQSVIQEDIETLQISVQDRLFVSVKIIDTLCDVE